MARQEQGQGEAQEPLQEAQGEQEQAAEPSLMEKARAVVAGEVDRRYRKEVEALEGKLRILRQAEERERRAAIEADIEARVQQVERLRDDIEPARHEALIWASEGQLRLIRLYRAALAHSLAVEELEPLLDEHLSASPRLAQIRQRIQGPDLGIDWADDRRRPEIISAQHPQNPYFPRTILRMIAGLICHPELKLGPSSISADLSGARKVYRGRDQVSVPPTEARQLLEQLEAHWQRHQAAQGQG